MISPLRSVGAIFHSRFERFANLLYRSGLFTEWAPSLEQICSETASLRRFRISFALNEAPPRGKVDRCANGQRRSLQHDTRGFSPLERPIEAQARCLTCRTTLGDPSVQSRACRSSPSRATSRFIGPPEMCFAAETQRKMRSAARFKLFLTMWSVCGV